MIINQNTNKSKITKLFNYYIRDKSNVISITEDKQIVSFLVYSYAKNKTLLHYIYTIPSFRNKGYALRLLNRLEIISEYNIIETLDKCGCEWISKYFVEGADNYYLDRVKLDMHIHIGGLPSTAKSTSTEFVIDTKQIAKYIVDSHITHACILYTKYEQLEQLSKIVPNVKLYGLQYYDIGSMSEPLDTDKPLWCGVKIHSHRNYSCKHTISYSTRGLLSSLFNRLPDDSIILPHFQGSLGSNPLDMMNNMNNFHNLKFIIGHSGSYGFMTYKPTIKASEFDQNKQNLLLLYMTSINAIDVAINLANNLPNVYLDSSIFVKHKAKIFNNCNHTGFGSDKPLGVMKDKLFEEQEILYCNNFTRNLHLNDIHKNAIRFIESKYNDRMQDFYKLNAK